MKEIDPNIITKILQVKEALKIMESTAILFIYENPTPIFTRKYNAEKQAMMQLMFSPQNVPNPIKVAESIRGYVC